MSTRRYVVIGAGAVGALLAAELALTGVDAVLVARGAALDAIRRRDVVIARPDRTDAVPVAVVGGPDELELRPGDVLVLAVKAQDAVAALDAWARRPVAGGGLADALPVVTLQNGVATEPEALRRFERVIGASVGVAAQHLRPGEVASPAEPTVGRIWLGGFPDRRDPDQDAIAADFTRARFATESRDDIRAVKAWKLLANLANALDLYDGDPADRAAAAALLREEARAVYAAAGIRAAAIDVPRAAVRNVPGYPAVKLSTWQSLARGASVEVDYLNGEIVLLGRLHGAPTPLNARVQREIARRAAAGAGVGESTPLRSLLAGGAPAPSSAA